MQSTKILMAALAVAVVAAPGVQAATVARNVEVPFEFVVADQQLPSGVYRIEQEPDARMITIVSEDSEHRAVVHSVPMAPCEKGKGMLVFSKSGEQRYLRTIRTGDGSGVSLLQARQEQADDTTVGMP